MASLTICSLFSVSDTIWDFNVTSIWIKVTSYDSGWFRSRTRSLTLGNHQDSISRASVSHNKNTTVLRPPYFKQFLYSWWRHQMKKNRVTGLLCREFTGHRWIPCTKASDAQLWWFFYLRLNNNWANNGDAGDWRRYRSHYDVMVMW